MAPHSFSMLSLLLFSHHCFPLVLFIFILGERLTFVLHNIDLIYNSIHSVSIYHSYIVSLVFFLYLIHLPYHATLFSFLCLEFLFLVYFMKDATFFWILQYHCYFILHRSPFS